jgi:hypothetical protein
VGKRRSIASFHGRDVTVRAASSMTWSFARAALFVVVSGAH